MPAGRRERGAERLCRRGRRRVPDRRQAHPAAGGHGAFGLRHGGDRGGGHRPRGSAAVGGAMDVRLAGDRTASTPPWSSTPQWAEGDLRHRRARARPWRDRRGSPAGVLFAGDRLVAEAGDPGHLASWAASARRPSPRPDGPPAMRARQAASGNRRRLLALVAPVASNETMTGPHFRDLGTPDPGCRPPLNHDRRCASPPSRRASRTHRSI